MRKSGPGQDVKLSGAAAATLGALCIASPSLARRANDNAVTEAEDAIRTSQADAGVRWTLNKWMKLVAGVFDVRKPYFNTDEANLFRRRLRAYPHAAIADKGYSSKANRVAARARGIASVIPHKANEKNQPAFFAKALSRARGRIEQGFGRLKRFKRVALRCEKTTENFRSIVSFAAGLCLIKSVHTA